MNVQEFAALKKGDKIDNPATNSQGEVTNISKSGVHVVWGTRSAVEREFFYSAVGTAWFSWSKIDETDSSAGIDSGSPPASA